MFNKKEIMEQAWVWFQNDEICLADIEWASCFDTEKTFGVCLKAAWNQAKERIENARKDAEYIAKSEELKAWNWAEKKLGVKISISDNMKVRFVSEEKKNNFYASIWKCGIKAVTLQMSLFPQSNIA